MRSGKKILLNRFYCNVNTPLMISKLEYYVTNKYKVFKNFTRTKFIKHDKKQTSIVDVICGVP